MIVKYKTYTNDNFKPFVEVFSNPVMIYSGNNQTIAIKQQNQLAYRSIKDKFTLEIKDVSGYVGTTYYEFPMDETSVIKMLEDL